MINSESVPPVEPEWRLRIERIRNRIMADPNDQIARFELDLRLMSTPPAAGAILFQLLYVIDGARGEARTHKRRVALGSLKYAVAKELEDEIFSTGLSGLSFG